jgi:hypothetical protein
MEIMSDTICNYSVPRIIATCTSRTHVSGPAENIHKLAFPFVTELGTQDNGSHQRSAVGGSNV